MPMDEQIIVFNKQHPEKTAPKNRKLFYDELFNHPQNSAPNEGVEVVSVFLFNTYGDVLLQKRSHSKRHNPNLLDKSIGGHIQYGDTPAYTVMVETVQELLTPSIVSEDEADFKKTFSLLRNYLDTVAIIKHVKTDIVTIPKVVDTRRVAILNKSHTYFGVYNGSTRPVDREALGILAYPLDKLEGELKSHPELFTQDLQVYMKLYGNELKKFIAFIKS